MPQSSGGKLIPANKRRLMQAQALFTDLWTQPVSFLAEFHQAPNLTVVRHDQQSSHTPFGVDGFFHGGYALKALQILPRLIEELKNYIASRPELRNYEGWYQFFQRKN